MVMMLLAAAGATAQTPRPPAAAPAPEAAALRAPLLLRLLQEADSRTTATHQGRRVLQEGFQALPRELPAALDRLTQGEGGGRLLAMFLQVLGLLACGGFVEWLYRRKVARILERVLSLRVPGAVARLAAAGRRLVMDAVALALFVLAAKLAFLAFFGAGGGRLALLFEACLLAVVVLRGVALVSRFLLSPGAPALRLVEVEDDGVDFLHRGLLAVAAIYAFGSLACGMLFVLGISPELHRLLVILVGGLMAVTLLVLIWRSRGRRFLPPLSGDATASNPATAGLAADLSRLRHHLAMVYVIGVFIFWVAGYVGGAAPQRGGALFSLMAVPLFLVLDRLFQQAVRSEWLKGYLLGSGAEEGEPANTADPQAAAEFERHARVMVRLFRMALFVFLFYWFWRLWGLPLLFGGAVSRALFNIVVTLLLAYAVWEFTKAAIRRRIGPEEGRDPNAVPDEEEDWAAPQDRAYTLLPLVRQFIGTVLFVMVVMIVLSSIGVDIGPLLAGAGVVGLAVGFGAQKVVRDIFSGFFFLMDDAFRVGEYLEAGGVSGTVEDITLRTIKLRHHRGMLQIVPLGDLKSVTNYMRGGIVVKFDLQLPYDTDIELVRKVVKKVGEAMMADPELAPDFIRPVRSQGVRTVGDSVMTFRVKFTAKPGRHFVIRREALRRITVALEAKGVRYAHRKVIVDLPPGIVGPPEAVRAAGAAALDQVLRAEEGDPKKAPEGKKKSDDGWKDG
jgi:small-conductance mechanosensitive channel